MTFERLRVPRRHGKTAAHNERQKIPVIRFAVSDLEALEHARRRLSAIESASGEAVVVGTITVDAASHALDSRALSELDRLIDQARNR